MAYADSIRCQQQLPSIEAIDYFIARQCVESGLSADSAELQDMVFHLLLATSWFGRQGHNCLELHAIANKTLWHDPQQADSGYVFPPLPQLQHVATWIETHLQPAIPLQVEQSRLYLQRAWLNEQVIARSIASRISPASLTEQQLAQINQLWPALFPPADAAEIDWQQVAVANALGRKLTIICGGPGTGKTYTVARLLVALIAIEQAADLRLLMAAPTGKAAQRLSESIQQARASLAKQGIADTLLSAMPSQAATLHRLLGYRPDRIVSKFNQDNKLPCDILLVDEVSMVDSAMMARLLEALPEQAMLILLGDVDQLPSVGAGCVLADLTDSLVCGYSQRAAETIGKISQQAVPVANSERYDYQTMLRKSHRFSGVIGDIAKQVIQCDSQQSWQLLELNELTHRRQENEQPLGYVPTNQVRHWLRSEAVKQYGKVICAASLEQAFSALAAFRVLVATRQGELGVEPLNLDIELWLAARYNGRAAADREEAVVVKPDHHYQGRPIMVTENDYALELFNGDIGLIWPDEHGRLMAWFEADEGRFKRVSLARLPAVEPVFAMTIHKTQGSEFGHVALVLPQQASELLSPELLYTGITRARQCLTISASQVIWQQALAQRIGRHSGLAEKIRVAR